MKKSFINYTISQTLLDIGGESMMVLVSERLHSKYGCNLNNCHKNPRQVNEVMIETCGKKYKKIIETITKNLEEFSQTRVIEKFLSNIK